MSPAILVFCLFIVFTFVVGVSLLFRGCFMLPDSAKLASSSDLQKAQADLKLANAETEKLRGQANTLAVQLEEMKGKLSWAEENVKALEEALKDGEQVQSRLEQLEKDLTFLSQKADSQANGAIEVITSLAAERESLQNAVSQNATVKTEDFNNLTDENQKLKIQIDGYTSKVKEMEALLAASKEADVKLASVQEELKKVRLENEEKIVQANAALVKLNSEIELLNAQITEKDERIKKFSQDLLMSRQETAVVQKQIEEFKSTQQLTSVAQGEDLQKQIEQLKVVNQHLQNKEKILIFKLAQARAQALSFEKICEEFKHAVSS